MIRNLKYRTTYELRLDGDAERDARAVVHAIASDESERLRWPLRRLRLRIRCRRVVVMLVCCVRDSLSSTDDGRLDLLRANSLRDCAQ